MTAPVVCSEVFSYPSGAVSLGLMRGPDDDRHVVSLEGVLRSFPLIQLQAHSVLPWDQMTSTACVAANSSDRIRAERQLGLRRPKTAASR